MARFTPNNLPAFTPKLTSSASTTSATGAGFVDLVAPGNVQSLRVTTPTTVTLTLTARIAGATNFTWDFVWK